MYLMYGRKLFTIDGLALNQIIIVLASQESVAITSDDTLDIATKVLVIDVISRSFGALPILNIEK